jgi:hypothetical protein
MKCSLCNQNDVKYQLVIHELTLTKDLMAERHFVKTEYTRTGIYCSISLCRRCLPIIKSGDYQHEIQTEKEEGKKSV